MTRQFPSIQSFFGIAQRTSAPNQSTSEVAPPAPSMTPGDGFTKSELYAALHPDITEPLNPGRDYEKSDISSLCPGPKCLSFTGRVSNLFDQTQGSKMPRAAKGCLKLVVKDDSGAITVKEPNNANLHESQLFERKKEIINNNIS